MRTRYAQWMHDWETRLTSVDNNRVLRPLDWGLEWMQDWPCGNGCAPADTSDQCERFLQEYNRRIVSASDEFYSYVKRSEEHTSELQSHSDLVCRLLLEKKKKKTK